MLYPDFIVFLKEQGCNPIPEGRSDEGTFFRNCYNGEICFIERIDRFSDTTIAQIVYELGIPPPIFLEDYYEVYKVFRKNPEAVPFRKRED